MLLLVVFLYGISNVQCRIIRSEVLHRENSFDEFEYACSYADFNFSSPVILATHKMYSFHSCDNLLPLSGLFQLRSSKAKLTFGNYLPNNVKSSFQSDIDIIHMEDLNLDLWRETNKPIYIGYFQQSRINILLRNVFIATAKISLEGNNLTLTELNRNIKNIQTFEYLFNQYLSPDQMPTLNLFVLWLDSDGPELTSFDTNLHSSY